MKKENCTFQHIAEALHAHQSFVIVSHMRPDGDAIGCQIAMADCLRQLGKSVTVWNEDGVPEKFAFLPESGLVTTPPDAPVDFDVAIALDTAVHDRVGTPLRAIGKVGLWINIDHHITNDRVGDLVFIDSSAPATGQILFEMIRSCGLPLTYAAADSLFAAISTDTGSFQYPNTTARTFEIGAELVRAGVNVGEISQRIYDSHPFRRIALLRELLNTLELSFDGRLATFALTGATAARLGVKPEDNEGLIDHIRAIQGVVAAVFLEEIEDGKVRLSMRSKDPRVDVSRICGTFGGGGHTLASGARTRGSLADVLTRVHAEFEPLFAAL